MIDEPWGKFWGTTGDCSVLDKGRSWLELPDAITPPEPREKKKDRRGACTRRQRTYVSPICTCVSVPVCVSMFEPTVLTFGITAILLTQLVLVEWELSCKDEVVFTLVIEWLWRKESMGWGKQGALIVVIFMLTNQLAAICGTWRNDGVVTRNGLQDWHHSTDITLDDSSIRAGLNYNPIIYKYVA